MKDKYTCAICKCDCEGYGNNPYPLVTDKDARCCDMCNMLVVQHRIALATDKNMTDEMKEKLRKQILSNVR